MSPGWGGSPLPDNINPSWFLGGLEMAAEVSAPLWRSRAGAFHRSPEGDTGHPVMRQVTAPFQLKGWATVSPRSAKAVCRDSLGPASNDPAVNPPARTRTHTTATYLGSRNRNSKGRRALPLPTQTKNGISSQEIGAQPTAGMRPPKEKPARYTRAQHSGQLRTVASKI